MWAYRSTPHSSAQETLNLLVLGKETRVPNRLSYHVPVSESQVHEYVGKPVQIIGQAHDALREKQWQIWMEGSEEPPPSIPGRRLGLDGELS